MSVEMTSSITEPAFRRDPLSETLPLVSVVIPVRNDTKNLSACLFALTASSFRDFEVIVVDDASTDPTTVEVAHAWGARVISLSSNQGPAVARNRGVEQALGSIVIFLDADVCASPRTIGQFVETFHRDPSVMAAFGSYDTKPTYANIVSQYKNLLHHFVHQHANEEASTFWSGCGAVRRSAFMELQGFDAGYRRPCIEDIEFGARVRRQGWRIVLNKQIQVTHRKRWTLGKMVRADIFDRAIPWTQLILRERRLPNDLNLQTSQRVSAVLACVLLLILAAASLRHPWMMLLPVSWAALVVLADRAGLSVSETRRPWAYTIFGSTFLAWWTAWLALGYYATGWAVVVPLLVVAAIVGINWRLFSFFSRLHGVLFALMVMPLHVLYFFYSSATFAMVVGYHRLGRTFSVSS